MLETLNSDAYLTRPDRFKESGINDGLWFHPGEDPHTLMKVVKGPSGLHVMGSNSTLDTFTATLGNAYREEEGAAAMIEVAITLPGKEIDGTLAVTITAISLDDEENLAPFITLADNEIVRNVSELREIFERVTPAMIGLTY